VSGYSEIFVQVCVDRWDYNCLSKVFGLVPHDWILMKLEVTSVDLTVIVCVREFLELEGNYPRHQNNFSCAAKEGFVPTNISSVGRGKSPNMGRFPNMGRCIISYHEVLSSLLRSVNHQADEAGPCNHSINGQLLRTSVLIACLCFGAL
jgi:hypothetical protein